MTEQATENEALPITAGDSSLPKISGYSLLREKSRGPKAVVYKAQRVFENDLAAIKLFHRGVCDRVMIANLEAGIEKTAGLRHSGLIRVLGVGTDDNRPFLVLEYASGESLSNFLFRYQSSPPAKALAVILYCARTLKFAADKGFVHGRLHPGRIVLGRNNVRIAGVGMGERPEHAAWTHPFPNRFEPLIYTPTEAFPSKPFPEKTAQAVDVYALGAMLFHLLTCMPPFKGGDEGSLESERSKLKRPVAWPSGARAAFPGELGDLIEAMLDPDPVKRPGYDDLIQKLSLLQAELQISGAEAWHGSASGVPNVVPASGAQPVVPPVLAATAKALPDPHKPFAPPPMHATAPASSSAAPIPTVPHVNVEKKKHDAHGVHLKRHPAHVTAKRSAFDVVFSTLLFCMTGLVFCCAVYVTIQPYLPEKYRFVTRWIPAPENTAQRQPAISTQPGKTPDATAVPVKALSEPVNPEEAALALRQLDKIQEMLRNGDILPSMGLAKVLRNISDRAGRTSPTGLRALIIASEIEWKVSPGKALEPLPQIPVTPPVAVAPAPVAPKADTPAPAKPEQPAANTPPPAAKPVDAPKPIPGIAAAVKQSRTLLKYFGYSKAKEGIDQFAVKGNTEQKRIAADYRTLISYEEGLYERCHAKLVEHIKKDPKHESILQVFPRKDDPVGDDIIDFDEKGLSILVKGGNNKGVKITPWDKFPSVQVLNLLLPLSTKNSLEDQIGLAVFAYNRGLTVEAEDALGKAEALPNGKDKAGAVADTFVKITRALDAPE